MDPSVWFPREAAQQTALMSLLDQHPGQFRSRPLTVTVCTSNPANLGITVNYLNQYSVIGSGQLVQVLAYLLAYRVQLMELHISFM